MIREFLQRLHVRVNVQGHGRAGVPETLRQLDRADALLIPQARAAMTESVGAEPSGVSHSVTETVAANAELEAIFERMREFFRDGDKSTAKRTLTRFTTHPDYRVVHIIRSQREDLTDAKRAEFHHHNRQYSIRTEAGE